MKLTNSESIQESEKEFIDTINAELDWEAIEKMLLEKHSFTLQEEIDYKDGDLVVYNDNIAYKFDFESRPKLFFFSLLEISFVWLDVAIVPVTIAVAFSSALSLETDTPRLFKVDSKLVLASSILFRPEFTSSFICRTNATRFIPCIPGNMLSRKPTIMNADICACSSPFSFILM